MAFVDAKREALPALEAKGSGGGRMEDWENRNRRLRPQEEANTPL